MWLVIPNTKEIDRKKINYFQNGEEEIHLLYKNKHPYRGEVGREGGEVKRNVEMGRGI